MSKRTVLASLNFACAIAFAGERHCLGPGDLSADHLVDAQDHVLLADCLAGPGYVSGPPCSVEIALSADFDQDGDVDLVDVSRFAVSFGKSYFDYGPYREDKEAEHLAIKLTDELRAPDYEYERIHRDLPLIHDAFPDTLGVEDTGTAADNGLIVSLVSNDDRADFDGFNSFYLGHPQSWSAYEVVHFCDDINPHVLSAIYDELQELKYATPDHIICSWCNCPRIGISIFGETIHYEYSFYYESPQHASCVCWRHRVVGTDEQGDVMQISCEDSCLTACP